MFRRLRGGLRPLLLASACAAVWAAAQGAHAQEGAPAAPPGKPLADTGAPPLAGQVAADAPTSAQDVEAVVVTAQTYALRREVQTKRDTPVVSDTIAANQIGALPEFGLGDALQRVPGVSFQINNGRGEAQFETVRGLNSDYNTVTIDGIALPSTEETRRQVSFDVLPSVIANQVTVFKTYTADQPTDAVGGVTNIVTHSAFEHPGWFIAGTADAAYWDNERQLHENLPSGQGDLRISKTFGHDDQFGALLLVSYYERSSNSLNSYTLPFSYYGYNAAAGGTQTITSTALTPTTNVTGLSALADRRRWYFYDNIRQRPGAFGKLEWDDHHLFHAHVTAGLFDHFNDEYRYSQYLNRGPATATFTSPTTANFSTGQAETDFDKYNQYRQISYVEAGGGVTLTPRDRIDAVFNYGFGFYRQDTTEDVFTSATNSAFAFNDVGEVGKAQLFVPVSQANFHNPALYAQTYTLTATDKSKTLIPQLRVDYIHDPGDGGEGLGWRAGYFHKETDQTYFYHEFRYNPLATANITLATVGALNQTIAPEDGAGQTLLLVDPAAVSAYLAAHPGSYSVAATNTQRSTLNNFHLNETIDAGYASATFRRGPLFASVGVRYENTDQRIDNYQPSPLTSTTNFVQVSTPYSYDKLLPALNVSWDFSPQLKLRGAVSQNLARPRYSDLAQNSSLTLSGTTATETVSNPVLRPRESTNYDLSLEWYPQRGAVLSAALFDKEIENEIFSLTTTQQNVSLPGFTGSSYTLITTTPANAGSASIRGVEFGIIANQLTFLPGLLRYFGVSANATLIDFDAPSIQMADGVTYRRLPQLVESSRSIVNAAIFYTYGPFTGEVAYNHTGKQPISFDRTNAVNDQWYRATDIVDAQLSYRIRPGVAARLQAKNIFATDNQKVVGPDQSLNYSLLDNGRSYYAGLAFAF